MFPPDAMVHTLDGPISMEQLQIGTMVLNRDGNYEPVITWLHKCTRKYTN